jgi:hypothetical protein
MKQINLFTSGFHCFSLDDDTARSYFYSVEMGSIADVSEVLLSPFSGTANFYRVKILKVRININ